MTGGSAGAASRDNPVFNAVILCVSLSNKVHNVRTNIEIDDKLMKDALRATGARTKREAVELGLKTLVRLRAQEKARELRGKITWEGDLNAMRTDR
jgi:Arc/MetJ family transcription regulator